MATPRRAHALPTHARRASTGRAALVLLAVLGAGCGGEAGPATPADAGAPGALDGGDPDASAAVDAGRDTSGLPYAREVVRYTPGPGAGFGQDRLPAVVLGPPAGKGTAQGSTDVVSLGVGGEIVLGLGTQVLLDGPGPDLVVFENAFWASGRADSVFAELGEVSVSTDAVSWRTFRCEAGHEEGRSTWPGCAGWTPTAAYDAFVELPLEPARTGGDVFDLAEVGLEEARYVRVRDLSTEGAAPTAGFDLDAVGLVHAAP